MKNQDLDGDPGSGRPALRDALFVTRGEVPEDANFFAVGPYLLMSTNLYWQESRWQKQ
jgi:hypothetical protein